jgi:hypothetical protein
MGSQSNRRSGDQFADTAVYGRPSVDDLATFIGTVKVIRQDAARPIFVH